MSETAIRLLYASNEMPIMPFVVVVGSGMLLPLMSRGLFLPRWWFTLFILKLAKRKQQQFELQGWQLTLTWPTPHLIDDGNVAIVIASAAALHPVTNCQLLNANNPQCHPLSPTAPLPIIHPQHSTATNKNPSTYCFGNVSVLF